MKRKTDITNNCNNTIKNWRAAFELKPLFLFYLIILTWDLANIAFHTDFRMVSKPLLIGLLLIVLVFYKSPKLLLLPLVFSIMGDVFLLFSSDLFFVLGLGSFLLAHVVYTFIFLRQCSLGVIQTKDYIATIAFVILGLLFLVYFWQTFEALKLPVILYVLVLVSMASTGYRALKQNRIGIYMFVFSDLLLGVQKFGEFQEHLILSICIMFSYGLAQYFIFKALAAVYKVNS